MVFGMRTDTVHHYLLKVVKVAVEQATYDYDKCYSYLVPEHMTVTRGCRVLVPFGSGNRKRQGIVVETDTKADVAKLKPISRVIDKTPLLNDEMMDLALWLKERTFCTIFDAVRAILPTGLYMRIKPCYKPAPQVEEQQVLFLTEEEKRLLALAQSHPEGIERDKLLLQMGLDPDSDLPDGLVRKGLLLRVDETARLIGDATVKMARLAVPEEELSEEINRQGCTPKQKAVLQLLWEVGCASVKELCYFASVTQAVVTALVKKNLIELYEHQVFRTPYTAGQPAEPTPIQLNEEQQKAYEGLLACYQKGASAALLYGVTGSGKTNVYLKLIDRVLQDGRQVLVLVPEISLTPQMVNLFLKRYGDTVAVLHSGLAIGERTDEWRRIQRGEARVVIGTRSAVFAPCDNLGLIVIDEEQEHTYKSESSPRYHARDVAKFRCARHKALLLLVSATPSIESYHAALTGRYSLFTLSQRYGSGGLPAVEVADMRGELIDGLIGSQLQQEIQNCLSTGRQVILLLNRRGYHTHVSCRSCGYVLTCSSCSISMTYHRANDRLICHYCGRMQPPPAQCPACGSKILRYAGLGTQRVEQELEQLFPEARILRMDADTTMSRMSYDKKFGEFAAGKFDIMIGTQMVAKGLDFPKVGLVGVLSADQALYSGDFRSYESAFSLLTQVVGRAGRRDLPGKAVIQTYCPEHYVIELASRQDYPGFYAVEIAARKAMKYPPYTDLCQFGFVGIKEDLVKAAAERLLEMLRNWVTSGGKYEGLPVIVLDPAPAIVSKVAGRYRYKLLMKTVNNATLRQMLSELMIAFYKAPENSTVHLFIDINPMNIL